MFTLLFDTVFPSIGYLVGYLIGFAQLPDVAVQYLLMGNTFDWLVPNVFTGTEFLATFYSYDSLLEIVEALPIAGNVAPILDDLLDTVGLLIYDLLFKIPDFVGVISVPLWVALPFAIVRMWFIMTIVKWILSIIR